MNPDAIPRATDEDAPPPAASDGATMSIAQAREAALGISAHIASASQKWSDRLADTEPGSPLLVERLKPGRSPLRYFMVPMGDRSGAVRALVKLDATTGRLGEIRMASADHNGPWWATRQLTQQEVIDAAAASVRNAPDGKGTDFDPSHASVLSWQSGPLTAQPKLQWKACAQSQTPFRPFYPLLSNGKTFWLDVDRQLHSDTDASMRDYSLDPPAKPPRSRWGSNVWFGLAVVCALAGWGLATQQWRGSSVKEQELRNVWNLIPQLQDELERVPGTPTDQNRRSPILENVRIQRKHSKTAAELSAGVK